MLRTAVSFVLTVYNKRRYLADVLASVAAQEGSFEREVIIVDDGSTDGSRELLKSLGPRLPRFRLIAQPNQGPSIATNRGLAAASMPLVKLLDGDRPTAGTAGASVTGKWDRIRQAETAEVRLDQGSTAGSSASGRSTPRFGPPTVHAVRDCRCQGGSRARSWPQHPRESGECRLRHKRPNRPRLFRSRGKCQASNSQGRATGHGSPGNHPRPRAWFRSALSRQSLPLIVKATSCAAR